MKKKKIFWGTVVFIIICAGVMGFLSVFTHAEAEQSYVVWNEVYILEEDGTKLPQPVDEYGNIEGLENGKTYVMSAPLEGEIRDAKLHLLTTESEVTFWLNGEQIYSESVSGGRTAEIKILLPENYTGQILTMQYRFTGEGMEYVTPVPFINSTWNEDVQTYAYGNYYGILAGVYGCIVVVTSGLFLFSLFMSRKDITPLLLAIAALILLFHRMAFGMGVFFLPENMVSVLTEPVFQFLPVILIVAYFLLNRRRGFWKYFGRVSACAGIVLAVAYLISFAGGTYLANFINNEIEGFLTAGVYSGLLYWITAYLLFVSIAISAYNIIRSIAEDRSEREALMMKNELLAGSYRAIKQNTHQVAALRHEIKNHIAAMNFLLQEGNIAELKEYLQDLNQQETDMTRIHFTENFIVNAILQNYATRAAEEAICFEAEACVPENMEIASSDLSSLLMNMLDNAEESCIKMSDRKRRYIRLRIAKKGEFLTVCCENPYNGELSRNEKGRLLTKKQNSVAHGYGIRIMEEIAKKYGSSLEIDTDGGVFRVQTALQLKSAEETH
ncbi:sensor histidine kinase [Christensenella tenuis]|uniref:Sensor histidine kinase n=1 Tax=Christensenella tenuis TaxID=2763033 RepID=A0ABR7ED12_9FIRM|nr:GHKL domain-containing protein [Christensenella tenuis]MBC5647681.1 sensor histidine kinase [Christensenella tenuis]